MRGRAGLPWVQGFTLIEALVALMILGIILSAVVPTFISNARINGRSELRAQAASAIEEVMDAKRTQPLDTSHFPTSGKQEQSVTVGGRTFTVELTYCKVTANCTPNSRMVTAEAYSGTTRVLSAETIFTEVNYVAP